MAGILSHTLSLTIADGTNSALVQPSDFNAGHAIGSGTEAYGLVPIGGIIIWAGTIASIPSGFALCDGSSLLRAGTYEDLFNRIGVIFGSVDSSHFYLPDLRDMFVVGATQDYSSVPVSTIRGTFEQQVVATGAGSLTHDGSVADHTTLTHAGASIGAHPDLTHSAISIADHPSTSMTISVGGQATAGRRTSTALTVAGVTVSSHAVTGATQAAITHTVTGVTNTHVGTTYGTHAITQPNSHGTITHSFTPPSAHGSTSIVPSFMAMAYIIRFY